MGRMQGKKDKNVAHGQGKAWADDDDLPFGRHIYLKDTVITSLAEFCLCLFIFPEISNPLPETFQNG